MHHQGRSVQLLQLTGLLVVAFSGIGYSQVQMFNCYNDCRFDSALEPDATCQQLQFTRDCYDNNLNLCELVDLTNEFFIVFLALQDNCETTTTETEVTAAPTPLTMSCPDVPASTLSDPTSDIDTADIVPEPHSCAMEAPDSARQCSMFSYSHMRPFDEYRTGLETCSVPGEWYLLKHPSIDVVVGSEMVPGYNITKLTKVNVTFAPSECSEQNSYVATHDLPLPTFFTDMTVPNNSNSPLQLKVSPNGKVITLLAVWINTTVIIRQFEEYLSVTIQVPGRMSFEGEGLCVGCPRHAYFSVSAFNQAVRSNCNDANTQTTLNCFFYPGILNTETPIDDLEDDSYADYCLFDTYKTGRIEILTLFKAIGADAKLVNSHGVVPIRPTTSPLPVEMTTTETTTTHSTQESDTNSTYYTTVEVVTESTTFSQTDFGPSSSPACCTLNFFMNFSALLITYFVSHLLR